MAKKVWLSFPLITASEANDAAVVSFLKGGLKKELEVETATFITKWMLGKSVPFVIAVESSSLERNLVVAPSPQEELQTAPGVVPVPAVAETDRVIEAGDVAEHSADTAVEQIAEVSAVVEPAGEQEEAVNDEPASPLNAPGGVGLRRARGRSGRRVPEASKAEE